MKKTPKTVLLLINPSAGSKRTNRVIEAASKHFTEPQWRLFIHILAGPEESFVLASQAASKGYHAVLAAGGDGTINEVAAALIHKKTRLGVIPSGTGNGFARALGMPLNFDKACQALSTGRTIKCDAGSLDNGRVFVNVCGVGMDAWIAHRANALRWLSRYSGFLRYFVAGLQSVFGFRVKSLTVRSGKHHYQGPMLLAVVANSEQYGFGTVIAPGAKLDDGTFDVVLLSPLSFPQILKNFFRLYSKKPLIGSIRFSAKEIEIHASDKNDAPLHLDGEPAGNAPIKVTMRPRSLNVIAP